LGAEDQAAVDAGLVAVAVADRQYAMTLAALREAVGLTQIELARKYGVPQSRISEREHSGDMLVSTLSSYLTSLGLPARLVVEIGDHSQVAVDLDALSVSH
jgi:transcriptional regulator with XRE-family HTH domain